MLGMLLSTPEACRTTQTSYNVVHLHISTNMRKQAAEQLRGKCPHLSSANCSAAASHLQVLDGIIQVSLAAAAAVGIAASCSCSCSTSTSTSSLPGLQRQLQRAQHLFAALLLPVCSAAWSTLLGSSSSCCAADA
jgi:hypothetical protein